MDVSELAAKWRAERGYDLKGGVIVCCDGIANGWCCELPNPRDWVPGCVAIDTAGKQWVSVGGNRQGGAELWRPVV